MSIKDISDKIPGWIALGIAFSHLSPGMQSSITEMIESEQAKQLEAEQARACGLTIEQFRLINSLPPHLIDWSKVGK